LPEKQCLTEDQIEKVRDWVLALSMDQEVDPSMAVDSGGAGPDLKEAGLTNESDADFCVVSNYPVVRAPVQCSSCSALADQEQWNKYVIAFKACPRCNAAQAPIY